LTFDLYHTFWEFILFTEFNIDDAKLIWQEEAREDGREENRVEVAANFIKEGIPLEVIARATGLPLYKVAELSSKE
jgi:hypothetical protein